MNEEQQDTKKTVTEAVRAASEILNNLAEAIKIAPMGIPCGELYAILMSKMTLEQYERMESMLLQAYPEIKKENHCLVWNGEK